jgi:hypothetical protein
MADDGEGAPSGYLTGEGRRGGGAHALRSARRATSRTTRALVIEPTVKEATILEISGCIDSFNSTT